MRMHKKDLFRLSALGTDLVIVRKATSLVLIGDNTNKRIIVSYGYFIKEGYIDRGFRGFQFNRITA